MARALGTTLPRFLAEVQRRGYDRAPLFEVTPDLLSEQTEARVRGRDEAGDVGGRIRSAVGERALSAYTAGKLAGARRRAGGEDGAEDVPVPRPPVAVFSTPA